MNIHFRFVAAYNHHDFVRFTEEWLRGVPNATVSRRSRDQYDVETSDGSGCVRIIYLSNPEKFRGNQQNVKVVFTPDFENKMMTTREYEEWQHVRSTH